MANVQQTLGGRCSDGDDTQVQSQENAFQWMHGRPRILIGLANAETVDNTEQSRNNAGAV